MISSTAYSQDTLIELPINIVRQLYADALMKDSCQIENQLLDSIIGKQELQLAQHHELIKTEKSKVNSCLDQYNIVTAQRDSLLQSELIVKQSIGRKNKWIARLGGISIIELAFLAIILIN